LTAAGVKFLTDRAPLIQAACRTLYGPAVFSGCVGCLSTQHHTTFCHFPFLLTVLNPMNLRTEDSKVWERGSTEENWELGQGRLGGTKTRMKNKNRLLNCWWTELKPTFSTMSTDIPSIHLFCPLGGSGLTRRFFFTVSRLVNSKKG
jgi:hypothetical protein